MIEMLLSTLVPLKEQIRNDTMPFVLSLVVWIPVGIWCAMVVGWMIHGEMDALIGIPGIATSLALGVATVNPPDRELGPIFFFCAVSLLALWPVMQFGGRSRVEVLGRLDEMERAYDRLDQKRTDAGALFKLASACWRFNWLGAAILMGEEACKELDTVAFREQHKLLAQWKALPPYPGVMDPIICPACKMENGPGIPYCPRCGERQYYSLALAFAKPNQATYRIVGAWIAAILLLVFLPVVALSAWPPVPKGLAMAGAILVGGFILVRAFILVSKAP